jgi:hypothetical protein
MTQEAIHYENAPITEAVIDIRVEPLPGFSVGNLQNVSAGADYPTIDPQHLSVGQIQLGPTPSATASSQLSGCPASAPMRQIRRVEEGRISGSS